MAAGRLKRRRRVVWRTIDMTMNLRRRRAALRYKDEATGVVVAAILSFCAATHGEVGHEVFHQQLLQLVLAFHLQDVLGRSLFKQGPRRRSFLRAIAAVGWYGMLFFRERVAEMGRRWAAERERSLERRRLEGRRVFGFFLAASVLCGGAAWFVSHPVAARGGARRRRSE